MPKMNILGEKQIQELLRQQKAPYIFLESLQNGKNFLFSQFETVVTFRAQDDIFRFFQLLEEYHKKGCWLAGYFTYEFGYYLDEAYKDLRRDWDFPLAWIAVARKPEAIIPRKRPESLVGLDYQIKNQNILTNEEGYAQSIEKIKNYIQEGLTYQVNYTIREDFDFFGKVLDLYFGLRRMQPTDYCAYIDTGEEKILSLSPELFFKIKNGRIIARPMKGTAARAVDEKSDQEDAEKFRNDAKIRAENLMIVDLVRNDIGRIGKNIRVDSIFDVEKHPTLFQMTSTIKGKLLQDKSFRDIFSALFPCGSVTGAPKVKTMQIISELEAHPRGVYTGAIGYISPKKEVCFNVAIRTVSIKQDKGSIGIGGGIVYDSVAAQEYKEAVLKAKFLTRHYPYFDLLETILWEKKDGYFLLDEHLGRIDRSAQYFSRTLKPALVKKGLKKLARKFQSEQMVVRLLVTPHADIKLEAREFKPLPQEVTAVINEHRLDSSNVFLYHKTTCRYWYDEALHKAKKQGFDEVIFLNERGEVTEGSFSNIFVQKEGVLYTPPLSCGLLSGTLRGHLLKTGKAKEKILYPGELYAAEKVFIGNSVRGLVRVRLKMP